jgi:hypothetical protein
MPPDAERRPSRSAVQAADAAESTTFVTSAGSLTVTWMIEARAHLLAAGRILELDPGRRHQARHIFGLAARVAV